MQTLDIRTLVLVAAVAAGATAALFLVIGRPQRRVAPELTLWAAAFASNAVGLTLIYLRGRVPAALSFSVANLLILAAAQLLLVGLDAFAGRSRLRLHAAYFAAALVALVAAQRFGTYEAFSGTLSVVLFVPSVALCARLVRMAQPGMGAERAVLVALFALEAALLTVRGVGAALGHPQATLFVPTPATILLYFGVILAPMLVGPALLALVGRREQLAKERLIGELTTALAEVRTLRASCRSARRASRSATTTAAGPRSRPTSRATPTPSSPTASARPARRASTPTMSTAAARRGDQRRPALRRSAYSETRLSPAWRAAAETLPSWRSSKASR